MTKLKSIPGGKKIPTEVKDNELVARRRRQIVDAAVHLFIRKGFHKTTTREIAKAAGFSIGTLYEYVTSKEDVLYLVCQAIHTEMEGRLKQKIKHGGNGSQDLRAAIKVYLKVCDQMSDHILLIYQETKSLPSESRRFVLDAEIKITGLFQDILTRGVKDFSLKPLNPSETELVAHNLMVMGHMWAFRRWALAESFSLDEYIELQVEHIMGDLI